MSAGPPSVRRSGRTRKAVTTYADEQAEDLTALKPAPKRKRAIPTDDDAFSEPEAVAARPKKKQKATKSTKASTDAKDQAVKRLVTTEKRPPGEKRPPRVWDVPKQPRKPKDPKASSLAALMAESFEDRYQRQMSRIPRLKPGQPETRLKAYVPEPTSSYETFLGRARTQRLVVLGRSRGHEENCHAGHDDCPYYEVKIAGTTGNVYTVIISHQPTCSCPNTAFKRKNSGDALCKHILYVLHFVLKAPEHLCIQNAFMSSELKTIDEGVPPMPTESAAAKEDHDGRRKPVQDDCPICCMDFEEEEEITWCRAACGNNIHAACFDQWARMKDRTTCPFCRTEWDYGDAKKGKRLNANVENIKMPSQRGSSGYYNVADQLTGLEG